MSAAVTSTLVTGSAATTSHRTGVGDARDRVAARAREQLRIGEEQRRIPAEQHEPGIRRASG